MAKKKKLKNPHKQSALETLRKQLSKMKKKDRGYDRVKKRIAELEKEA